MWMLITVICLQTGPRDAECRREVRGPYLERLDCGVLMVPLRDTIQAVAADVGAPVLFERVWCEKGSDL